jgi:hypothetical protein
MTSFGEGLAQASRSTLLSVRNTALDPSAGNDDVDQLHHALD